MSAFSFLAYEALIRAGDSCPTSRPPKAIRLIRARAGDRTVPIHVIGAVAAAPADGQPRRRARAGSARSIQLMRAAIQRRRYATSDLQVGR
jgi:hypothetical protein